MTEDHDDRDGRLDERTKAQGKRIDKLEANQKWGVLTVLGLAAKAIADFIGTGPA